MMSPARGPSPSSPRSPSFPSPPPLPSRSQDEAESFAERKIASLADEMRRRVEEVANVQSHIKLVAEGIRELMMLSPEPDAHRRGAGGFGNAAAF